MADADFTVSLIDKMSGPARSAAASLAKMEQRVESLRRAAKKAEGMSPADRWKAGVKRVTDDYERLNQVQMQCYAAQKKVNASMRGMAAPALSKEAMDPYYGLKNISKGGGFLSTMTGSVMFGNILANIASMAGRAAIAVVRFGIQAAAAFGKAVVGAAMFAEKATSAFNVLLGKGAGGRALREVTELAGELGLPVQDTISQFQRLLTMGFGTDQAKNLVRMTADMQALGASADQTSRVMLALSQIKATGKLQGDELMQLAEAGVPVMKVYEQLGKQLGKTVPEIQKMKEQGKISADEAIKAVQAAMLDVTGKGKSGELAKSFADSTLTGAWSRFKSKGMAMLMELGRQVSPILKDTVAPMLKDITKALSSPTAKRFLGYLVDGFKMLAMFVKSTWDGLKEGFKGAYEGITKFFGDAKKGAEGFNVESMSEAFRALGMAIGAAAAAAVKLVEYLGKLVSLYEKLPDLGASGFGLGGSKGINYNDAIPAQGLSASMPGMAGQAQGVGTGIASGIATGIKNGASSVVQAAVDIATSAISAAKRALGIASPSKVFQGFGAQVAAGMEKGITSGAPAVSAAAGRMINPSKMGGTTQNISAPARISMTVQGSEDPQQTAAAVAATLEQRLAGMFESVALQVSVANG